MLSNNSVFEWDWMRLSASGHVMSAGGSPLPMAIRATPNSEHSAVTTRYGQPVLCGIAPCRLGLSIILFSCMIMASGTALSGPADGSTTASSQLRLVILPALQVTGVDDIQLRTARQGSNTYSDELCLQGSTPLSYRILARADSSENGRFVLTGAQDRGLPFEVRYRADLQEGRGEVLKPGSYSTAFVSGSRRDACEHGRSVAFDLEVLPDNLAPVESAAYTGSITLTLAIE